jgi:hypothetical protein
MADDQAAPPDKPEWAPRMWQGCGLGAWFRLLFKNRFAVHPIFWHIIFVDTFVCLIHSVLGLVQTLRYGRAVARTPLVGPPIFIIGHWRTGTTLLHELMVQDSRFGFPTTYECIDPCHFLLTESTFSRWFQGLMPKHRPMDRMKVGFDRPQEDEFAFCMLGMPSPYLTIAFPNRPPQDQEYLDLVNVPPRALANWKRRFLAFLKTVTFKQQKRLVLKSPPHTARIKVLNEMFPDALYVHIVRDPYVVFPSTVKLWKILYETHGFQVPTFAGLEEQVFETYLRMHERLDEGRRLVGPKRIVDVRYEDLVADPEAALRSIYERLDLGGWEAMRPRLAAFVASLKGYETNKYELSAEQREEIGRRWGRVAEKYGYEREAALTPSPVRDPGGRKPGEVRPLAAMSSAPKLGAGPSGEMHPTANQ